MSKEFVLPNVKQFCRQLNNYTKNSLCAEDVTVYIDMTKDFKGMTTHKQVIQIYKALKRASKSKIKLKKIAGVKL